MIDTPENLAASHRAATANELAQARRVSIKRLTDRNSSPENAQRLGQAVAEVISASAWARTDEDGTGGQLTSGASLLVEEFKSVTDLDQLNAAMDRLGHFGDAGQVWAS